MEANGIVFGAVKARCLNYTLFFIRTSKFWPRLVLKVLDNCFEIVLKIVLVSIMSIILILFALWGTV